MYSRIWVINALLVLLAVFFGLKAHGVWSPGEGSARGMGVAESRRVQPVKRPVVRPFKRQTPPESAYNVVISKNLFSPQRTEAQSDKTKQNAKADPINEVSSKQAELLLKRIMLYGVVITDDYAAALVTDIEGMAVPPTSMRPEQKIRKKLIKGRQPRQKVDRRKTAARQRGQKAYARQTKWVKSGDTLGDFKVAEIMEERVVLKIGSQSYDLLLYDRTKPKTRAPMTARPSPTVVITGGSGPVQVTQAPKERVPRTKVSKRIVSPQTKQATGTRLFPEQKKRESARK